MTIPGGRKFLITVLLLIVFFVFVLVDKMTIDQFTSVVQVIAGTYIAGNVVQKFVKP